VFDSVKGWYWRHDIPINTALCWFRYRWCCRAN